MKIFFSNLSKKPSWYQALHFVMKESSETQSRKIKNFLKEEKGYVLPMVDLLALHGYLAESMELLEDWIGKNPGDQIAKVHGARLSLDRGLVTEARRYLKGPIHHSLAWQLSITCAFLAGEAQEIQTLAEHSMANSCWTEELKEIWHIYNIEGLPAAQKSLVDRFSSRGITVILTDLVLEGDLRPTTNSISILKEKKVCHFSTMPLRSVFSNAAEFSPSQMQSSSSSPPVSKISSDALAELYSHQGNYKDAMSTLKELLLQDPDNDRWKKQLREYSALEKEKSSLWKNQAPSLPSAKKICYVERQRNFIEKLLKVAEESGS